eukprot:symbB.v1.2.032044.t1/scaffold3792.1/size50249/2
MESKEPWRCYLCKRLNKASTGYCGSCGRSWEQCWDKEYVHGGNRSYSQKGWRQWTAWPTSDADSSQRPKSPRRRQRSPRKEGKGGGKSKQVPPGQQKWPSPVLDYSKIRDMNQPPAAKPAATPKPAESTAEVQDLIATLQTTYPEGLPPELQAKVDKIKKTSPMDLKRHISQLTKVKKELDALREARCKHKEAWKRHVEALVQNTKAQLQQYQNVIQDFDTCEEELTSQFQSARAAILQITQQSKPADEDLRALHDVDSAILAGTSTAPIEVDEEAMAGETEGAAEETARVQAIQHTLNACVEDQQRGAWRQLLREQWSDFDDGSCFELHGVIPPPVNDRSTVTVIVQLANIPDGKACTLIQFVPMESLPEQPFVELLPMQAMRSTVFQACDRHLESEGTAVIKQGHALWLTGEVRQLWHGVYLRILIDSHEDDAVSMSQVGTPALLTQPMPMTCRPNADITLDFDDFIPQPGGGRIIPPPNWNAHPLLRFANDNEAVYRNRHGFLTVDCRTWLLPHGGQGRQQPRDIQIRAQLMLHLAERIRHLWRDIVAPGDALRIQHVRPTPLARGPQRQSSPKMHILVEVNRPLGSQLRPTLLSFQQISAQGLGNEVLWLPWLAEEVVTLRSIHGASALQCEPQNLLVPLADRARGWMQSHQQRHVAPGAYLPIWWDLRWSADPEPIPRSAASGQQEHGEQEEVESLSLMQRAASRSPRRTTPISASSHEDDNRVPVHTFRMLASYRKVVLDRSQEMAYIPQLTRLWQLPPHNPLIAIHQVWHGPVDLEDGAKATLLLELAADRNRQAIADDQMVLADIALESLGDSTIIRRVVLSEQEGADAQRYTCIHIRHRILLSLHASPETSAHVTEGAESEFEIFQDSPVESVTAIPHLEEKGPLQELTNRSLAAKSVWEDKDHQRQVGTGGRALGPPGERALPITLTLDDLIPCAPMLGNTNCSSAPQPKALDNSVAPTPEHRTTCTKVMNFPDMSDLGARLCANIITLNEDIPSWEDLPSDIQDPVDMARRIAQVHENDVPIKIRIYTDGSKLWNCERAAESAAWAYVVLAQWEPEGEFGLLGHQSGALQLDPLQPSWSGATLLDSFQAECEASIHALLWACQADFTHMKTPCELIGDASSVINIMTGQFSIQHEHIAGVLRPLYKFVSKATKLSTRWQKAHNGEPFNELADHLAKMAAAAKEPSFQRVPFHPIEDKIGLAWLWMDQAQEDGGPYFHGSEMYIPIPEALTSADMAQVQIPEETPQWMTLSLKMMSCNVNSFKDLKKNATPTWSARAELIKQQAIDTRAQVLAWQETRRAKGGTWQDAKFFAFEQPATQGRGGVALWFRKDIPIIKGNKSYFLEANLCKVVHATSEMMVVKYVSDVWKAVFVTAHAPTDVSEKKDKDHFWMELEKVLSPYTTWDILVGIDANGRCFAPHRLLCSGLAKR